MSGAAQGLLWRRRGNALDDCLQVPLPAPPPASPDDEDSGPDPAGAPAYPPGTLVQVSGDPAVYAMDEQGVRHHVPDPATFNALGYTWSAIEHISPEAMAQIPLGAELPRRSAPPASPPTPEPAQPPAPAPSSGPAPARPGLHGGRRRAQGVLARRRRGNALDDCLQVPLPAAPLQDDQDLADPLQEERDLRYGQDLADRLRSGVYDQDLADAQDALTPPGDPLARLRLRLPDGQVVNIADTGDLVDQMGEGELQADPAQGVKRLRAKYLANDASDEVAPGGVLSLSPSEATQLADRLTASIRDRAPLWDPGEGWDNIRRELDRADHEPDPRRRLSAVLGALDAAEVVDPPLPKLLQIQYGELWAWISSPRRQMRLVAEGASQAGKWIKDKAEDLAGGAATVLLAAAAIVAVGSALGGRK